MALVACSECGKQISDKATFCPHCGNPLSTTKVSQSALLQEALEQSKFLPLEGEDLLAHARCSSAQGGIAALWRPIFVNLWLTNIRLVIADSGATFLGIGVIGALTTHFTREKILWQCPNSEVEAAVRLEKYRFAKVHVFQLSNGEKYKVYMFASDAEKFRAIFESLKIAFPTTK